jgi:hypothetical protein
VANFDSTEPQVSHVDLYHKLGKLEGLMETMMASVSTFQGSIRDLHGRIDSLETRQTALERMQSGDRSAVTALTGVVRDFAVPVLAIAVAWFATKDQIDSKNQPKPLPQPVPHHSPASGRLSPGN